MQSGMSPVAISTERPLRTEEAAILIEVGSIIGRNDLNLAIGRDFDYAAAMHFDDDIESLI